MTDNAAGTVRSVRSVTIFPTSFGAVTTVDAPFPIAEVVLYAADPGTYAF